MIPRKLTLKNFLCYGDTAQEIDFKDYSLICLSGKNGYGKSALLDAMTWAVWGQARKVTGAIKADDGLLRLGQSRMMVSFEFELGNKRYHVRREFAKTYGKPYAALDFEVFEEQAQRFVSLTDKTIKQTQDKIDATIGLDFDTFLNSAFLRQNQSNEFSKKTPKERKQILANILGLSKYDLLQQAALDKAKKFIDDIKFIQKLQEQYLLELEKKPVVEQTASDTKKNLIALSSELDHQHKQLIALQQQEQQLVDQQRQYEFLTQQNETLAKKATLKKAELLELRAAWQTAHRNALHLPDTKKLEAKKQYLREQEKIFITQQQAGLALHEHILQKKENYQKVALAWQQEQEKTLQELRRTRERAELETKHLATQLTSKQREAGERQALLKQTSNSIKELAQKLQEKQIFTQQFQALKSQFDKRRTFYNTLVQRGNYAKNTIGELDHKKKAVDDQTSPSCPLCLQILTAKRKQFLSVQFSKEDDFLKHRLTRVTNIIKKLKQLLLAQHEQVQQQTAKAEQFAHLQAQHEELVKKEAQLMQECSQLEQASALLLQQHAQRELECTQLTNAYAEQEKAFSKESPKAKELETLAQEIKKLVTEKEQTALDQKAYAQLQEAIKKIEAACQQVQATQHDLGKQESRKERVTQICSELKEDKQQVAELELRIKQLAFNPQTALAMSTTIANLAQQASKLSQEKEQLLQTLGRLENELQRLEKVKKEQIDNINKLNKLEEERDEYQIIAQAFSKNGIQALLIEEAIPEVEEEANAILGQLTNNQSQIFIESLHDLKSGGVKETLVIKISDAAGMRPYEMFSGGEAFRIDFALRIAISKLLARRAGTALQTLIIDEGFGSQDEEGLARLMNAIHAIQHDFSRIIIVSHLPEFKDNFPVHFIVEKGPSGSQVHIEERG
ncbi:SMC family ATPase [Candidatus Babeliales bacterium]|nr:SMC family ATPase [Candidatus Babeliales bacterium]